MKSSRIAAYLLLSAISAAPAVAQSPGRYTIFDVQGAGTEIGEGTFPASLNATSSVSGYYIDSSYFLHGFVRAADGTITTFDAAGPSSETEPLAINREGTVGGFYTRKTQTGFRGFLRNSKGRLQKISAGGVSSSVYALNDKGEAVGTYATKVHHIAGYLRTADGNITSFQDPKAGRQALEGTFPLAVNNAGLITGQYVGKRGAGGFVRNTDGTFTNFKVSGAGGGLGTYPTAINQGGTVAGEYTDSNNTYHAFIRDTSGKITTFDAPGAGTGSYQGTLASSEADDGTVAGFYYDANNVSHGYLRRKDGSIRKFDAPRAGTGSGDGTFANAINNTGVIAGYAVDNKSVSHGFLRAP